jgi:predicted acetyltransferase
MSDKITNQFTFINPGKLVDEDLELILVKQIPADSSKGYVPMYVFEMRHPGNTTSLGEIRLRIGSSIKLRYPGHIGYNVNEEYRGQRYAARSCLLILPLAYVHGLREVLLTCDPKNIPSRKTCEIIGAEYIDTLRIPSGHQMYQQGLRHARRYKVVLKGASLNLR